MSPSLLAFRIKICRPMREPPACTSLTCCSACSLWGLISTATGADAGTISLSNSSRLPSRSIVRTFTPERWQSVVLTVDACANPFPKEHAEGGVQFLVGAGFRDDDPLTDRMRCLLKLLQLTRGGREGRIQQHADQGDARHQLAQKAQPLRLHQSGH